MLLSETGTMHIKLKNYVVKIFSIYHQPAHPHYYLHTHEFISHIPSVDVRKLDYNSIDDND